jgi:hypothetical protein
VPAAIGAEIGAALPADTAVERWWRLIGVVQGLLLGCVLVGIAWFVALLVLGAGHVASGMPKLFSDVWLLPLPVVMVAAGLLGGWLTARISSRAVNAAASRETEALLGDIEQRMGGVATELVLAPAVRELDELARFRAELRTAAGEFRLQ